MDYNTDFNYLPQKCSHPVRIPDVTRPGHYMYVPCGHCEACIHNRRSMWMRRLRDECSYSKHVLFFTLTYDNKHIPKARVLPNKQVRTLDGIIDFRASLFNPYDYVPISHYSNTETFGYCRKADVQNFFKRLRRRLAYDTKNLLLDVPQADRSFRYFVCSEYGPQTFRPHYHGLLFFRSDKVFEATKMYFAQSWKLCSRNNIDYSEVVGNAAGYVAKYINCSSSVPSVLKHKAFKTFYLFSRSPAIGAMLYSDQDICNNIYSHTLSHFATVISRDSVASLQLADTRQSVCRFFPKPCRFFKLSRSWVLSLLSFVYKQSYKGFYRIAVSDVARRYGVGQIDSFGHKVSWSDLIDDDVLSMDEYCYGVPQNRHFFRCFLNSHLSPVEFCTLLYRLYSEYSSDYIGHNIDCYNFLISKGFSVFQCISLCYPNLALDLPDDLNACSNDVACDCELLLNSFGLTLADCYDDNMLYNHCFDFDFTNTSLFKTYMLYLKESSDNFDKVRLANHFNNININNYDAF